jgi:beta-1,2-mannosyltransferase
MAYVRVYWLMCVTSSPSYHLHGGIAADMGRAVSQVPAANEVDFKPATTVPDPSPLLEGSKEPEFEIFQFDYEEKGGKFQPLRMHGFENNGVPGGEYVGHNLSCSSLAHSAAIGVQESFFLDDDIMEIAADLDGHPMIDYAPSVAKLKAESYTLADLVESSWDRLATACVFMPDYGVYLCVTRIIYHPGGAKDRCRINFLRGQIYSQSWIHLDRYHLTWQGQEMVFPKIFDTDTEFKVGGQLYGPEDARIVIEEGVEGAEPVVVFNMISTQSEWKRAMWIFRPFSQRTRILTIRETTRPKKEKNWAPFFLRELEDVNDGHGKHRPSKYIHFVWHFEPLTVVKCHLQSGMCDVVFEQAVLPDLWSQHGDHDASLRGGTQLVPIPLSRKPSAAFGSPHVQAFVAFPRTHSELKPGGCKQAFYRPHMTVLTTNTTHFYLSYGSEALDFGSDVVMDAATIADPCGKGRIMITNSVAGWDMNARVGEGVQTDVMSLTLSVDDATVQVLRVSGVWDLLRGLPSLAGYFEQTTTTTTTTSSSSFPLLEAVEDERETTALRSLDPFHRADAVGWDVRACLEEAALTYLSAHLPDVGNGITAKKPTDEEQMKKKAQQEEEQRKKKADEEKKKKAEEENKKAIIEEAKVEEKETPKAEQEAVPEKVEESSPYQDITEKEPEKVEQDQTPDKTKGELRKLADDRQKQR